MCVYCYTSIYFWGLAHGLLENEKVSGQVNPLDRHAHGLLPHFTRSVWKILGSLPLTGTSSNSLILYLLYVYSSQCLTTSVFYWSAPIQCNLHKGGTPLFSLRLRPQNREAGRSHHWQWHIFDEWVFSIYIPPQCISLQGLFKWSLLLVSFISTHFWEEP